MEMNHPTLNLDGTERKIYFDIETIGNIEERHGGKHIGELMNEGKIPITVLTTMLWQGLQTFATEDFDIKGERGRRKVAQMMTDWLKIGDQKAKWGILSQKIVDAMSNSGLISFDKKKEVTGEAESPSLP